jgi:hypothetical protein
VLIDCDGRFNALRFEQLLQARIRTALARQWRGKARAMAAEAMGALDDQADALVAAQGEQALQAYFASDDYAALRTHCLANLLIFRPQSPRALLGVLLQIDQACAAYNNPTWASKHKTIGATGAPSMGQHDESQRMDMGGQLSNSRNKPLLLGYESYERVGRLLTRHHLAVCFRRLLQSPLERRRHCRRQCRCFRSRRDVRASSSYRSAVHRQCCRLPPVGERTASWFDGHRFRRAHARTHRGHHGPQRRTWSRCILQR